MKLKNKKTGEIFDGDVFSFADMNSLAELNEEWEDYEEDELLYVVSAEHRSGYQCVLKEDYPEICKVAKELGIGFETEKECQKTVEKLKAWKRLKDKGFSFHGYDDGYKHDFNSGHIEFYVKNSGDVLEDLDLLFSGEDD